MFDFEKKKILLIGGGQNIGREMANEFAARGADLDILSQRAVAILLADAMEKQERLILTHEKGWDTVAAYGAAPNKFVSQQQQKFLTGDNGIPVFKGIPE